MKNNSFVEKYRPTNTDEVVGHSKKLKKVQKKVQKNDPVILYGPAGTGKTSTAESIAKENGWNISEINASSARTKSDIISIAQQIRTESIDGNKTLFILDELDSIDGRSLKPLLSVLDEPPNPIIGTANEKWKIPDGVERRCDTYKFDLDKDDIKPFLKKVAQKEGIDITSRQLGQLATRNGLRDALNDLQQFSETDSDTDWDSRQTEDSPFAVTERVLRGKDYIGGQDMTPPDMVDFIDENITGEFQGVALMRAYQALSSADKWHGLVNRTQNYSWWKYSGSVTEEVANLRLSEPWDGWMNINYPLSRRQSSPYSSKNSSVAQLYRELKEVDEPNYKASFNFREFTRTILPMFKDMDKDEKCEMILSESLSEESMKELGVTPTQYEDWLMEEEDRTPEETQITDFSVDEEADDSEDDEPDSVFDF